VVTTAAVFAAKVFNMVSSFCCGDVLLLVAMLRESARGRYPENPLILKLPRFERSRSCVIAPPMTGAVFTLQRRSEMP
jgi:hypothetical protein